jgi:SAM-dependent methyltransferase
LEIVKLTFEEYWGYYWRVVQRHKIPGIFQYDRDLVDFIEQQCKLKSGDKILDLGCGGGDQLKLFAVKGYRVVGIDKVPSLVEYANEIFKKEGLKGEFHTGDMRKIEYRDEFDLCTILSGSFGFFSDEENERLLVKIHRALKPGGQAFIDYLSIEESSHLKHTRSWNPIDDGYMLAEEWYDIPTSTYRARHIQILNEGKILTAAYQDDYNSDEIIRCYGHCEIEMLAEKCGFKVKAHLGRKQLSNPDYIPDPGEPRRELILEKES